MLLLFNTSSTNPDFYGGCDCAVLDITEELLATIRRRVEIARTAAEDGADLWELHFWSPSPAFYDHLLVDACAEAAAVGGTKPWDWENQFIDNGHVLLPETVQLDRFSSQRTECDQQIVRSQRRGKEVAFEIAWIVSPKHTDVYVTTDAIAMKELEAYGYSEKLASEAEGIPLASSPPELYRLRVDGPLFQRQRNLLLELREQATSPEEQELLEGPVAFTDEITDQAHDRYGIDCLLDEGES